MTHDVWEMEEKNKNKFFWILCLSNFIVYSCMNNCQHEFWNAFYNCFKASSIFFNRHSIRHKSGIFLSQVCVNDKHFWLNAPFFLVIGPFQTISKKILFCPQVWLVCHSSPSLNWPVCPLIKRSLLLYRARGTKMWNVRSTWGSSSSKKIRSWSYFGIHFFFQVGHQFSFQNGKESSSVDSTPSRWLKPVYMIKAKNCSPI